jgi:hypothetical protein
MSGLPYREPLWRQILEMAATFVATFIAAMILGALLIYYALPPQTGLQ